MTNPKYMRPSVEFAVGKLVEELGELQAALGKTIRWGWQSYNPELPEAERETNEDWVVREMKDVGNAINHLLDEIRKAKGQ
jgi:hypothetical protein